MPKHTSPKGNPLPEPRGELPPIVVVHWRDSAYVSDYDTAEDAYPYILLYTVGFLMRNDDEGVVLGGECEDDKGSKRFRHIVSIPRDCIMTIKMTAIENP